MHTVVAIDTRAIIDWDSFHQVFAEAMGFLDFYGGNMNAWVDCMTYLDEPDDSMTTVQVPPGGVLVLALEDAKGLATRCPDIYAALIECSAFVNHRRLELGDPPVITLSFHD